MRAEDASKPLHKHNDVHTVKAANAMINLDDDGFTVDDNEVDDHPNQAGQVYDYVCFGGMHAPNCNCLS